MNIQNKNKPMLKIRVDKKDLINYLKALKTNYIEMLITQSEIVLSDAYNTATIKTK
jgi:hypothetical protein